VSEQRQSQGSDNQGPIAVFKQRRLYSIESLLEEVRVEQQNSTYSRELVDSAEIKKMFFGRRQAHKKQ
jgi:hypothetical protein